jgi:hypothetical protein
LEQIRDFLVYRDANRDATLDLRAAAIVRAGKASHFRLHRMGSGPDGRNVGKFSAGCQGPEDPAWLLRLLRFVKPGVGIDYALFPGSAAPGLRAR